MEKIPVMREVMTPSPKTVLVDQTIEFAQNLMKEYDIRHLPVMDADELVGILSDRDINLALSVFKKSANELFVREVFVAFPYRAGVNDKLDKVLRDMVSLRIGSVLILEKDQLAGIFTTMDACSVLSEYIACLPQ